jgi:D-sedoheptulose 7-phosphate isomerase
MEIKNIIDVEFKEHLEAVRQFQEDCRGVISQIAYACEETLRRGGKILFCGNGGSAADAQHIAAEFVVRYRKNRPALAALALTTDSSVLTATGNDFGYEEVFSRQVEALGNAGDLLVGISTSGTSPNVVRAVEVAKSMGIRTVAFCGGGKSGLAAIADIVLAPQTETTARIQECHLLAAHIICGLVEDSFS